MTDIHIATMLKDEADRYLRSALDAWSDFADNIFAMDDGSTDETPEILADHEDVVMVEPLDRDDHAWGNEWRFRERLFKFIWVNVELGDIIFVLDGDMCPVKDPSEFFEDTDADSFAFYLLDLWATDEHHMIGQYARERFSYRHEPPFWTAHTHPRTWAVRVTDEDVDSFVWERRGIHSGHLPTNWRTKRQRKNCIVPKTHAIAHWGYFDPEDQQKKYQKYMEVEAQLTEFEHRHAESIVSDAPMLRPYYSDINYVLEKS